MKLIMSMGTLTKTGGVERYVVEMVTQLLKFKEIEKIYFVCSAVDENTVPKEVIKKLEIIKVKLPPYSLRFIFESRRVINKLKKKLGKDTIVYTQQGTTLGGDLVAYHAVHLASIFKINRNWFGRIIRLFYPPHIRRYIVDFYNGHNSKINVAVSKEIGRELVKYMKVPQSKVVVMYEGVNSDEFKRSEEKRVRVRNEFNLKNKFVAMFVSHEFKRKNLITVIKALGILNNKDIVLFVAGKDSPGKYKEEAERLGIGSNVIFLGKVSNIQDYFSASDIFVFPTFYEALELSSAEAMASSLPVITSKASGWYDIIEENKAGFILKDNEDEKELADKINILYKDKDLRKNTAINARKTAEKYTWERTAKETVGLFKKILKIKAET